MRFIFLLLSPLVNKEKNPVSTQKKNKKKKKNREQRTKNKEPNLVYILREFDNILSKIAFNNTT